MKLNQNSITAKIYRWFYGTDDMPSNLCPYFWKLVTALIFGFPFFIITLPFTLVYRDAKYKKSFGERLGISILIFIMLFMAIAMLTTIGLFWSIPENNTFYFHMATGGIICWLAVIVLSAIELYKYLKERREDRIYKKIHYDANGNWIPIEDRVKEKHSYILVEMAKATYHKYCPKIDWK